MFYYNVFNHSWYIYEAMVRIYKHYDFKLRDSNAGETLDRVIDSYYNLFILIQQHEL